MTPVSTHPVLSCTPKYPPTHLPINTYTLIRPLMHTHPLTHWPTHLPLPYSPTHQILLHTSIHPPFILTTHLTHLRLLYLCVLVCIVSAKDAYLLLIYIYIYVCLYIGLEEPLSYSLSLTIPSGEICNGDSDINLQYSTVRLTCYLCKIFVYF